MEGKKEGEEIEETSAALPTTIESTVAAESDGFTHNMGFLPQSYNGYVCSEMDIKKQGIPITKDHLLPIYLKFEDVGYKVKNSHLPPSQQRAVEKCIESQQSVEQQDEYKQILKGLNGSAGPGEILALLGPSGSGKTTLLKIVAGRLHEHVSGKITYNDTPFMPALKRRIGFVPQDDVLFPQLTVEETLIFSAFLRLPSKMSKVQKRARVEMIVKELGLERCQHTRIGGAFTRGLSGGERKRTCIGYEILVDPSLLLLDEPTSGLDSTTAVKLLQTLQGLSRAGRTVITTIHQPSSRMFCMFDKILLISEGCPLYYGKADRSMEYFSSLGFNPKITMNPAEFLLDLATGQVDGIRIPQELQALEGIPEFDRRVVKFLGLRFEEELGAKAKDENTLSVVERHLREAIRARKEWTLCWWDQFVILLGRTYRERRSDYLDKLRMAQSFGVAVLLGLLWWRSERATEAQLRDQIGLLFYVCIFWTSISLFGAVYVFPFEKLYLVKERKAEMYRLSVYYMCSTLCDMMAHLLYPTFFMTVLYFMVGFKTSASSFFLTLFTILLIAVTSQGAGELFGATVFSIKRAGTVASLFLMLFLLTGGYYVQRIPRFMQWLKYTSFMYYGFRLLLKVQYSGEGELYECGSEGGCRPLHSSPSFDIVDFDGTFQEAWVLLSMAVGYRLCTYICLHRRIRMYHV